MQSLTALCAVSGTHHSDFAQPQQQHSEHAGTTFASIARYSHSARRTVSGRRCCNSDSNSCTRINTIRRSAADYGSIRSGRANGRSGRVSRATTVVPALSLGRYGRPSSRIGGCPTGAGGVCPNCHPTFAWCRCRGRRWTATPLRFLAARRRSARTCRRRHRPYLPLSPPWGFRVHPPLCWMIWGPRQGYPRSWMIPE